MRLPDRNSGKEVDVGDLTPTCRSQIYGIEEQ